MQYVVQGSAGICGTDFAELIEASSLEEANQVGYEIAVQCCQSYGIEPDEDDEDGINFEVDYWVEPYNPEKHDCLL